MDKDDDPEVVFIGGSTSDYKNKQPMRFDNDAENQVKVCCSIAFFPISF